MTGHCLECLQATIKLKLFDKIKDRLLIDDLGEITGLELMNVELLK